MSTAPAPASINRRLISGERVLCRCALELPKHDPFSSYREHREGYIVMNVRGGSLYLTRPLGDGDIERTFPRGKASTIKRFTLHPETGEPIVVGDVQARFLKTRHGLRLSGLVLRFVGLDERQMNLLNALPEHFPVVEGDEEAAIPIDAQSLSGDPTTSAD